MVDFFLLLLLPSGGDSLQGIKRGIMELADGILVTKADESPEQARRTVQDYRAALHLTLPNSDSGWGPFVMPCASVTGFQLDQVDEYLANYEALTKANGAWAKRRAQQQLDWFADLVQQELRQQFFTQGTRLEEVAQLEEAISAGALSPLRALRILFGKA
jgi:LAO/AO transport system kinase